MAISNSEVLEYITKLVDDKMNNEASDGSPVVSGDIKTQLPWFYTVDDALHNLDEDTIKELQHTYINKTEAELLNYKTLVRAEGALLTDYAGNEYIDFLSSLAVAVVGYNNDYIWETIKKCGEAKPYVVGAVAYHSISGAFAHNMAMLSPGQQLTKIHVFTSGSEAIENVIKMIKLACRNKPRKSHILACEGGYHGMTTGAISMMGNPELQLYQTPLMANVDHIPFGDEQALEKALSTGKYSGFFVETIQGEGGIRYAPEGYFARVRELCDQYDTIFVADEIQCGCGRSGKLWAIEHEGVIPDILTFGKGFSGACIPVAGFMAKKAIYDEAYENEETFEFSIGTYQHNDLCCAVANGVLEYIYENNVIQNAADKGAYMLTKMQDIARDYPQIVKAVRGRGMMLGIEFNKIPAEMVHIIPDCLGVLICNRMVDVEHVMSLPCTNDPDSLHILPPVTITKEQMDRGLAGMRRAIEYAALLQKAVAGFGTWA